MDFILANDWLQVINDAQQKNQENTPTAIDGVEVNNLLSNSKFILKFLEIYRK
jgi:hypothetical protein